MAVAVRAVGTVDNGTTSCAPGLPAGTVANDILVMFTECIHTETVTVSGWTEAANSGQSDATASTKLQVFWKRAVGSDATTTGGTTNHVIGRIIGFSGCRVATNPWDATAGSADSANSATVTIPGATSTVANTMAVAATGTTRDSTSTTNYTNVGSAGGWTNANLGSLTEQIDNTTATGAGGGFGVVTGTWASTGSFGNTTGTCAVSSARTYWSGALAPELAPSTPTLNSPADAGASTSLTPQVAFTGTDGNSDDLRYNALLASQIIDTYELANGDLAVALGNASTHQGFAQSFHGANLTARGLVWLIKKTGAPTGNAVAKIYAETHVGSSFGIGSKPTGGALATSNNLDVTTLTTTATPRVFTFGTPLALSAGTDYCVTIEYTAGDGSNFVQVYEDLTAPTHAGNNAVLNAGSWTAGSPDMVFVLMTGTTYLDKISGTDTGFADITNSGDTDPFASGSQVGYTVQAGDTLTDGNVYSWTARAIDPNGSNTYSGFAAYRTFTAHTTITATAALADGGTLSATATRTVQATASLAGAGTVTTAAVPTVNATALLAGSGTLTAQATPTVLATAATTGNGSLTATAIPTVLATATLDGGGTLAAAADVSTPGGTVNASATLNGGGTVMAAATVTVNAAAAITGGGTLAASADVTTPGSATASLTGGGTVHADATTTVVVTAVFAGGGTISATAVPTVLALLGLSGGGIFAATVAGQTAVVVETVTFVDDQRVMFDNDQRTTVTSEQRVTGMNDQNATFDNEQRVTAHSWQRGTNQ